MVSAHRLAVGSKQTKQWPQYVAVLSAILTSVSAGMHFGWPSPSIPKITSDEYHLKITEDEASYIAIILSVGDVVGSVLAALLADLIGRKKSILTIAVPHLMAWILIAVADSSIYLYAARLIAGIGEGAMYTLIPMYIGEVAEPSVRGVLGSSITSSYIMGILLINCIGSFTTVSMAAIVSTAIPIIFILTFLWMPETPYYYIMKKHTDKAKRSLQNLRGSENVDSELKSLTADVQRQMSESGTIKDLFLITSNRKALMIMTGLRSIQQLSGISAFAFYTQTIFQQGGGDFSPAVSTIIYVSVQLAVTTGASFFLDKFGRRPLLISSCFGCAAALLIEGLYFIFKDAGFDVSAITWLPILGMLTYIAVFGMGLGTVVNVMSGELFSTKIKARALCLMNVYFALMISVTSKFFQAMSYIFGMYFPFLFFAAFCVAGIPFSYFFVPETKGKTLEEIQQYLKGNLKKTPSTMRIC